MAFAKSSQRGELIAFVRELDPETPYHELRKALVDAGWVVTAREIAASTAASVATGSDDIVVRFNLLAGKDPANLEVLDEVTVRVPSTALDPSLVARSRVDVVALYMLFGRLPPQIEAQINQPGGRPAPAETHEVRMNGHDARDIVLDTPDDYVPYDDGDGGEYVPEDPVEAPAPLRVIESREADGLPIFADLYEVAADTRAVISATLDAVEAWLEESTTLEQVDALARKNPHMRDFLKDLGEPEDLSRLKQAVLRRRGQIDKGVHLSPAARRRAAAEAN